jgi:mono/diheme cytochrome c family protein
MRIAILFVTLLTVLFIAEADGGSTVDYTLPSNAVPSGKVMYKQYCAVCHGVEAKGDGPYASMLKVPPPNLTTLKRGLLSGTSQSPGNGGLHEGGKGAARQTFAREDRHGLRPTSRWQSITLSGN